jgi:hypothetical protein
LRTPPAFIPPDGYDRIKIVSSFEELMSGSFGPRVNAICWQRRLEGDFDELAACFRGEGDDIVTLDEDVLNNLRTRLSPQGRAAADVLIEDQRLLSSHGLSPNRRTDESFSAGKGGRRF